MWSGALNLKIRRNTGWIFAAILGGITVVACGHESVTGLAASDAASNGATCGSIRVQRR
jgi:hypothetical protein